MIFEYEGKLYKAVPISNSLRCCLYECELNKSTTECIVFDEGGDTCSDMCRSLLGSDAFIFKEIQDE